MTKNEGGAAKPPALHERVDVFGNIAGRYNGENNLELVQEGFLGALMMLNGTAIPKDHDENIANISTYASLVALETNKLVIDTLEWIRSEKVRNAPKQAAPSIDDHRPDHAERHATELGAGRG